MGGERQRADLAEDVVNHIRDEGSTRSIDGELVVSVVTVPNRDIVERLSEERRGRLGQVTMVGSPQLSGQSRMQRWTWRGSQMRV
jgi:hypothetical protein